MARLSLTIKKADMNVLYAFLDVLTDILDVNIKSYKPRLSRTFHLEIEGSEDNVKEAERLISKFAAKVGWRIES